MRIRIAILIFLMLVATNHIFACSCGANPDFLTVASKSKLVALVKINRYLTFKELYAYQMPMSMEAEIITVFHGSETRKTITIWGDNGYLCRPYLNRFTIDNYYVIAFQQCSDYEEEKKTDYSISVCGEYWLSADNEQKVAINRNQDKVGFGDLLEYFNGGDKAKASSIIPKRECIVTTIYRYPHFIGGDSVFQKFISDEIHKLIPKHEFPSKGSTSILFTVTRNSEVEQVTIVSKLDSVLENKIIKIMESTSKKWLPAWINGIPIDVTLLLDIYWQRYMIITLLHRPPDYANSFSIKLEE